MALEDLSAVDGRGRSYITDASGALMDYDARTALIHDPADDALGNVVSRGGGAGVGDSTDGRPSVFDSTSELFAGRAGLGSDYLRSYYERGLALPTGGEFGQCRIDAPAGGVAAVGEEVSPELTGRLAQAFERAIPKLPENIRRDVEALLTPANLAIMAGLTAVWAGSHFFGVGEIADVGLLVVGVITLGSEAFTVAGELKDFIEGAAGAKTPEDLDRAADHLAQAIARVGVDALAAFLTHKAAGEIGPRLPRAPAGQVEMVTPEGFRIRVPVEGESPLGLNAPMESRAMPNSKYAGRQFPVENLPPEIRAKYPAGVRFTEDGFPDFSPYAIKEVKIKMKGNRTTDFTEANRAAGLSETPEGYTWHHHQDRTTMQLVPTDLHEAVRHGGGVSLIKQWGPLP